MAKLPDAIPRLYPNQPLSCPLGVRAARREPARSPASRPIAPLGTSPCRTGTPHSRRLASNAAQTMPPELRPRSAPRVSQATPARKTSQPPQPPHTAQPTRHRPADTDDSGRRGWRAARPRCRAPWAGSHPWSGMRYCSACHSCAGKPGSRRCTKAQRRSEAAGTVRDAGAGGRARGCSARRRTRAQRHRHLCAAHPAPAAPHAPILRRVLAKYVASTPHVHPSSHACGSGYRQSRGCVDLRFYARCWSSAPGRILGDGGRFRPERVASRSPVPSRAAFQRHTYHGHLWPRLSRCACSLGAPGSVPIPCFDFAPNTCVRKPPDCMFPALCSLLHNIFADSCVLWW